MVLAGSRFLSPFRGVWICSDVELTPQLRVEAARLILPADSVVSHTTALRLHGVDSVPDQPLHFSTNTSLRTWQDGIVLHRRQGLLHPQFIAGAPVVGPDRAFVDSALLLGSATSFALATRSFVSGTRRPSNFAATQTTVTSTASNGLDA
jgi:hypothetical protein